MGEHIVIHALIDNDEVLYINIERFQENIHQFHHMIKKGVWIY